MYKRDSALQEFKQSGTEKQLSTASLKQYVVLQEFTKQVSNLCGEGERQGALPGDSEVGLVSFLENVRDQTWGDMKAYLSE